jgi:hypothetical protein
MTPQEMATQWSTNPIAGIAFHMSEAINPEVLAERLFTEPEVIIVFKWVLTGIQNMLPGIVSFLAANILLVATNAGLIGISRFLFAGPISTHSSHAEFRTQALQNSLFFNNPLFNSCHSYSDSQPFCTGRIFAAWYAVCLRFAVVLCVRPFRHNRHAHQASGMAPTV